MNALNWFEIPAVDFDRAVQFYSTILDAKMELVPGMEGIEMAFLPSSEGGVGGAVTKGEGHEPSQIGTLVYLNGGDDLSTVLDRVEAAGGEVALPKTSIGENGFFGLFIDTEGNKVGLHSMG
jgi:predicted enzyme related to lactoylglutathione lyase